LSFVGLQKNPGFAEQLACFFVRNLLKRKTLLFAQFLFRLSPNGTGHFANDTIVTSHAFPSSARFTSTGSKTATASGDGDVGNAHTLALKAR
jgi:hypothetical protein